MKLLIESKVDKAKKHLNAGMKEVMQAISLLGQEAIVNDAYKMRWESLLSYAKGLQRVSDALNEKEKQG